ncbi:3-oxoacyl-[acyl-carrier-protein] reductase FabG [subsurface metagenome]
MNSLKSKKALITGAASGIGRAITEELAKLGAEVFIHYFSSADTAETLVDQIRQNGGTAYTFGADLTKEDQVIKMFQAVGNHFGSMDILVNNTGDLVARHLLEDMSFDFYRQVLAVNLDSMMLVTRAAIPLMKDGGGTSIVNLASLAGRKGGHPGSLIYATAKGAVLTFTRALAIELAPQGIRVNAIAPGLILGSRFHEIHTTEEAKRQTIADIPLHRAGYCEDIARAAAFLASEYNGFITGATLDINGGVYMA